MNKIQAKLHDFGHWYQTKIPKPVRFTLFYGTAVVWFPLIVVIGIAVMFIAAPIELAVKLYREFDQ